MRFVRLAVFFASFVILFGATVGESMAGSTNTCATTSGTAPGLSLLTQLKSIMGPTQTCGGTTTASKQCCAQSLCNCTIGGISYICQGGSNKNKPNPNAPCCLDSKGECFCQGKDIGHGAVCTSPS